MKGHLNLPPIGLVTTVAKPDTFQGIVVHHAMKAEIVDAAAAHVKVAEEDADV